MTQEDRMARARAALADKRAAARSAPSQARTGTRKQYTGRNGEVLSRNIVLGSDPYDIPAHLKEPGWDYQWLTEQVYNNNDVVRRHNNDMYQAGWRPVMATGPWNGVFAAPSYTGHVTLGSCALYERPMDMTLEAKAEEERKARQQMRDRDQSLMGGKANLRESLPSGMEMSNRYRGTGADLRMSIDPALDAPAPSHQLADDGVS